MDVYEKTVPMSTYLVAFMVSKFKFVKSPQTDAKWYFRIWAREGAINQVVYEIFRFNSFWFKRIKFVDSLRSGGGAKDIVVL
jgi:hypothetical protein